MTENEMITNLVNLIKVRFKNSRLQNPDYKNTHFYSPQWKIFGKFYTWEFKGRVYASRDSLTGQCEFHLLGHKKTS